MDAWFKRAAEELAQARQAANAKAGELAQAAQKTVSDLQIGASQLASLGEDLDEFWTPPAGTKVIEFGKGSLGFKLEGIHVVAVQKDSQAERLGVVIGHQLIAVAGYKVPTFKADDVEGENAAREFISNTMKEVGRPIALTFAPPPQEEEEEEAGAQLSNQEVDQTNGQEPARGPDELPQSEGAHPVPPQQAEEALPQQEGEVTQLEVEQLQVQEDLQEPGRQAEPEVQPEQPLQVEPVRQSEQEQQLSQQQAQQQAQQQQQQQQEEAQAQEQPDDLLPQVQEHVVIEEAVSEQPEARLNEESRHEACSEEIAEAIVLNVASEEVVAPQATEEVGEEDAAWLGLSQPGAPEAEAAVRQGQDEGLAAGGLAEASQVAASSSTSRPVADSEPDMIAPANAARSLSPSKVTDADTIEPVVAPQRVSSTSSAAAGQAAIAAGDGAGASDAANLQRVVKTLTASLAKLKDRVARQAREIEELTAKLQATETQAANDVANAKARAEAAETGAARLAEELRGIGGAHETELDLQRQEHHMQVQDLRLKVEHLQAEVERQRKEAGEKVSALEEAIALEQTRAREAVEKADAATKAAAVELEAAAVEAAEARRLQAEAIAAKQAGGSPVCIFEEDVRAVSSSPGGGDLLNGTEAPPAEQSVDSLAVARLYDRIDELESRCNSLQAKLKARPVVFRSGSALDDADSLGAGAGHGHPFWLPLAMRFAGPRALQWLVLGHTLIDQGLRSFTVRMLQREWLMWSFYGHLVIMYCLLSLWFMQTSSSTPEVQLEDTLLHSVAVEPALAVQSQSPTVGGAKASPFRSSTSLAAAALVAAMSTTASSQAEAVLPSRPATPVEDEEEDEAQGAR